eukprot:2309124-Rhodomonas_salina.1
MMFKYWLAGGGCGGRGPEQRAPVPAAAAERRVQGGRQRAGEGARARTAGLLPFRDAAALSITEAVLPFMEAVLPFME